MNTTTSPERRDNREGWHRGARVLRRPFATPERINQIVWSLTGRFRYQYR